VEIEGGVTGVLQENPDRFDRRLHSQAAPGEPVQWPQALLSGLDFSYTGAWIRKKRRNYEICQERRQVVVVWPESLHQS
jgi:hypothetical protein